MDKRDFNLELELIRRERDHIRKVAASWTMSI